MSTNYTRYGILIVDRLKEELTSLALVSWLLSSRASFMARAIPTNRYAIQLAIFVAFGTSWILSLLCCLYLTLKLGGKIIQSSFRELWQNSVIYKQAFCSVMILVSFLCVKEVLFISHSNTMLVGMSNYARLHSTLWGTWRFGKSIPLKLKAVNHHLSFVCGVSSIHAPIILIVVWWRHLEPSCMPKRKCIYKYVNLTRGYLRGALAQAFTSDHFGRRGSILIWALIFTVGVAVQTGTDFSIVQITIGRFIAGLGVGAMSGMIFPFQSLFFADCIWVKLSYREYNFRVLSFGKLMS